ncbi:hypothetical protein GWK47_008000 [Chionoecetes opilio]|uniref:Uncharacterized protein n=1 Tax=Chionoecetes opilio TaxID=41210 RepID=A0A8J4XZ38_CHIOP|nr:hypothetical protein GWK47_008000 [Chionoecetes opilio]
MAPDITAIDPARLSGMITDNPDLCTLEATVVTGFEDQKVFNSLRKIHAPRAVGVRGQTEAMPVSRECRVPQAEAGESDIQDAGLFPYPRLGEESLRYWPMEVMRRASPSVLFQVERQTREIRRLAAESGRGKGVVFTSVKDSLAAESATSLPGIPAWEGTHWKAISHPSLVAAEECSEKLGVKCIQARGRIFLDVNVADVSKLPQLTAVPTAHSCSHSSQLLPQLTAVPTAHSCSHSSPLLTPLASHRSLHTAP